MGLSEGGCQPEMPAQGINDSPCELLGWLVFIRFFLRGERVEELLPIPIWNGVICDSVAFWPFVFGQMMSSKQPIQKRKMNGVVDVDCFFFDAVVPVVISGCHKKPLHWPKHKPDVRMHQGRMQIDNQNVGVQS